MDFEHFGVDKCIFIENDKFRKQTKLRISSKSAKQPCRFNRSGEISLKASKFFLVSEILPVIAPATLSILINVKMLD